MLKVVEIFRTFQGEGTFIGVPSLFLRLGRCNLSCPGCDTKFDKWDEMEVEYVADRIRQANLRHIVVTGGEPTLWQKDIAELIDSVDDGEWTVETNGAIPLVEKGFIRNVGLFSFSPKVGSLGRDEVFKWEVVLQNLYKVDQDAPLLQIKYVLDPTNEADLERVADFQDQVDEMKLQKLVDHDIFFQPYDTGTKVNQVERTRPFVLFEYAETLARLSDVVARRFGNRFRVLPQLHKIVMAGGGLLEEVASAKARA